jgi:hypothetical protein
MILGSEVNRREAALKVLLREDIGTWGWAWPEGYPKSIFRCHACNQEWFYDDSEPLVWEHIETPKHKENYLLRRLSK